MATFLTIEELQKRMRGMNVNELKEKVNEPIPRELMTPDIVRRGYYDCGVLRLMAKILENAGVAPPPALRDHDYRSMVNVAEEWFVRLPAAYSLFLLPAYHESDEARTAEYMRAYGELCAVHGELQRYAPEVREGLAVLNRYVYSRDFQVYRGGYHCPKPLEYKNVYFGMSIKTSNFVFTGVSERVIHKHPYYEKLEKYLHAKKNIVSSTYRNYIDHSEATASDYRSYNAHRNDEYYEHSYYENLIDYTYKGLDV